MTGLNRNLTQRSRIQLIVLVSRLLCPPSAFILGAATLLSLAASGQTASPSPAAADPDQQAPAAHTRIFGIIPNYRTYPTLASYKPISTREKFKIARDDSFDRGTIALAAAFAGEGQWTNADPSFGQGVKGYAHYLATAYSDQVIGNFMTEAIYPTLFHQDPRFFRRGTGSGWSRFGYAMGQTFRTHTDSGRMQFNYSEILGNSTAVAISTAYYPGGRDVSSAVTRLSTQIGVDTTANILKEFWPDLQHRFFRSRH